MAPIIEKLLSGFNLGEGPHWDEKDQCLYFVDINPHTIHKYDPSTKKHTSASVGNHNVSIIIPVKGKKDEFIISLDQKVAKIVWDGESDKVSNLEEIHEVDKGTRHVFNDGKCDSTGRIWIGTMGNAPTSVAAIPDGQGTLYSFQKNQIKAHRSKIGIANGIAFNDDLKLMYYVDSYRGTIDQYDFDIKEGTLGGLTSVFTRELHDLEDFLFDGMTIDSDGNLWVAVFGFGVIKIDPRKPENLLESIKFPAKQITSVAFGGRNLDELYVTSAQLSPDSLPDDGSLFRVTGLNVQGLPAEEAVL